MAGLSSTYMRQGRWKDVEVLALHVGNSRQAMLGPDNPVTLAALSSLVGVYKGQARRKQAESLAIELVDMKKNILSDSHPKTLRTIRDLTCMWQA